MNINSSDLLVQMVVILITFNVVGSFAAKLLYWAKDKSDSKIDNALWSALKKALDKARDGIDILLGNPKH